MSTPISSNVITPHLTTQRPLRFSSASLPIGLPPEVDEMIDEQLDVTDCQNFFEALTIATRDGGPLDSPVLKWYLLQQKVPAGYRYSLARSDQRLQTFALGQLKILWKSGQLKQIVERRALMELVKWVGGPALFRFLQERIEEEEELQKTLLSWVKRSEIEEVQPIAADALMLLVKADVDMTGYDFKQIRVPGADLSGAQFDGANFEEADLKQVNFHRARLRGANLERADLTSVYFGKLPMIELGSDVINCFYSSDERWLVTESYDEIKLYRMETFELIHTFPIYSHSEEDPVAQWDEDNAELEQPGFAGNLDGYRVDYLNFYDDSMSFATDGRVLALAPGGRRDGLIKLWRLDGAQGWQILRRHRGAVKSMAFSPDGKLLAAGSTDGRVRLWKVGNPEEWHVLEGHTNKVVCVQFSPDGKLLASGSRDGTLKLWNVESGKEWHTIEAYHDGPPLSPLLPYFNHKVATVKFSPNGEFLVLGYWYEHCYIVLLCSVESGRRLDVFYVQGDHKIEGVDFSPNSEFLVVFNNRYREGTGILWSIKHRKQLKILKGHTNQVESVKFSPDNRYLASGSRDGTVKLWSTESWEILYTYRGYKEVKWINFSLDSKILMWKASRQGKSMLKLQNIDVQRDGSYFGPSKKKLKIINVSIKGARGLSLMDLALIKQNG